MKRLTLRALIALAVALLIPAGLFAHGGQATLGFEQACLDLDTDAVDQDACDNPEATKTGWDVRVAHHADRPNRAVIFPNASTGVEVARLENVVFDEITADDVAEAEFTKEELDEPFEAGCVVLVRTDNGVVYKLGNPSEDASGVSFDYEPL